MTRVECIMLLRISFIPNLIGNTQAERTGLANLVLKGYARRTNKGNYEITKAGEKLVVQIMELVS